MKSSLYVTLLFFLLFLSASCKTYRKVENIGSNTNKYSVADDLRKLNSGEKIRIKEKSGETYDIEYFYHTEEEIVGAGLKAKKGVPVTVKIDNIAELKVKRVNWPVTAIVFPLAIAGIAFSVLILSWGAG